MNKQNKISIFILTALAATAANAQESQLSIAGFGGKVQEDLAKTLWLPAAEQSKVNLRQESHDGMGAVRVQVQSGNPGWDIVHIGAEECAVGEREGLFEALDKNVVDTTGLLENAIGESWVGINSYSVVLGWRTDTYGENPPQGWKDFWDTESFPGRRSLSVYPQEMMELALLADGVEKDDLYPLDTQRALESLAVIQPNIDVWWRSGAQSAQLIADGEVDMVAIWGSRVQGVIDNGSPVSFTYNEGIVGNGCLAILKGSDNVEKAQEFIANVISPEIQARIPEVMPYYGPTNQEAFNNLSSAAQEAIQNSNTSPENLAQQVAIDPRWWGDNAAQVQGEYRMMMVR